MIKKLRSFVKEVQFASRMLAKVFDRRPHYFLTKWIIEEYD